MSDYKGIAYLQRKLAMKRPRVLLRYTFYEQKQSAKDFGISTPQGLEWFQAVNGWCTKAVDALADRIQFDGFDNDSFMFQEMYDQQYRRLISCRSFMADCDEENRRFSADFIASGMTSIARSYILSGAREDEEFLEEMICRLFSGKMITY